MKEILFSALENRSQEGLTTFGAPFEKNCVHKDSNYILLDKDGVELPLQSRITAFWPDSSVKWTAHTTVANKNGPYRLQVMEAKEQLKKAVKKEDSKKIVIEKKENTFYVDANRLKVTILLKGSNLIQSILLDDEQVCRGAKFIYVEEVHKEDKNLDKMDSQPKDYALHIKESGQVNGTTTDYYLAKTKEERYFLGEVEEVIVEEAGELFVSLLIKGIHRFGEEKRMPFHLRMGITYNQLEIRLTHTFYVDTHGRNEFMKGIGLSFDMVCKGEDYNKHIKILGEEGIFHETSALLTSWRPRVNPNLYKMQMKDEMISKDLIGENETLALKDITKWNSYRIYQGSANHYHIKKSTGKKGCSYIDSLHGKRAKGIVAIVGEGNGVAIGMRHFYEKYPSSIWVDNLSKESVTMTAWFWSLEHEAMDFRHYDDVGHASAYYEGFDEVLSTPYGIACTNELTISPLDRSDFCEDHICNLSNKINQPPMLVASPNYYHQVQAFGVWSLKEENIDLGYTGLDNRCQENKYKVQWIEEQMDHFMDFYLKETEQRQWYGLFNYGDVMHTYDEERHMWKYDMGGYAWQNTELVPTYWLWYAFLRSGREDIFTLAEAMTRHCSEIDIYHFGEYQGLGSRHNVLHWGCSCKEPRIAMAGHHRFYYYMTGDYRLRDIFEEVLEADKSSSNLDPLRHFYKKEEMVFETHARTGPDWSSYCSNWMTSYEQTGDSTYLDKFKVGLKDLKKSPYGMVSGSDYEYNPKTGNMRYIGENAGGGSHLAVCMGGPQIWFELCHMIEDKEFEKQLADYGVFYFLDKEEKTKVAPLIAAKGFSFPYMAASLGAYGAKYYKNQELANKLIHILYEDVYKLTGAEGIRPMEVEGTSVGWGNRLEEIPWISTNFAAQWCVNAIVTFELVKEFI